jgi:simple sugar transport system substrate-binding protein/ribose transport system substrate-binding protein
LSIVASGCGKEEAPAKPEVRRFVIITNAATDEVSKGAELGAKAVNQAMPDAKVDVEIKRAGTAEAQVAELQRIASSGGADGVAIDAVPVPEVSSAIAQVTAAGIPVVTFNSDAAGARRDLLEPPARDQAAPGRQSFVGTSLDQLGAIIGSTLLEQLGDLRGPVAVVSAPQDPTLTVLETAVADYLKDVPNLTLMEPIRPAMEPGAVTEAINTLVRTEANLRGLVVLNPAAAPNAEAAPLAQVERAEVVMLAFSDTPFDAIASDRVDAVVMIPFVEYGSAAVQMLSGMTLRWQHYPDVVSIGPAVVTINTLDRAKARLKAIEEGEAAVVVVPRGAKPGTPTGAAAPSPGQGAEAPAGAGDMPAE